MSYELLTPLENGLLKNIDNFLILYYVFLVGAVTCSANHALPAPTSIHANEETRVGLPNCQKKPHLALENEEKKEN